MGILTVELHKQEMVADTTLHLYLSGHRPGKLFLALFLHPTCGPRCYQEIEKHKKKAQVSSFC